MCVTISYGLVVGYVWTRHYINKFILIPNVRFMFDFKFNLYKEMITKISVLTFMRLYPI